MQMRIDAVAVTEDVRVTLESHLGGGQVVTSNKGNGINYYVVGADSEVKFLATLDFNKPSSY